MVNASTIRFILTASGLIIMMFILMSDSSTTSKSIGVILSIILITMGVVVTTSLRKHFEETREGTLRPPDSPTSFN